jgi:hypothetical protein
MYRKGQAPAPPSGLTLRLPVKPSPGLQVDPLEIFSGEIPRKGSRPEPAALKPGLKTPTSGAPAADQGMRIIIFTRGSGRRNNSPDPKI